MTKAQVGQLLEFYFGELVRRGAEPRKMDEKRYVDEHDNARIEMENHLAWACKYAKTLLSGHGEEGAMVAQQWLGFVQGALWALGVFSIEEMRQHDVTTPTTSEED